MTISLVVLHIAGAVALLLWAIRMVRTGVERSQLAVLRRFLRPRSRSRLRFALGGMAAAVLLQSSTAVALLAGGFTATGVLTVSAGLAVMLGADLGSALVVQVLSLDLVWLVPVLLILGVGLFLRGTSRAVRQAGRILIGIALVIVSLDMIGEATNPLRESAVLPQVVAYLRADFVSAFLLAALFTWTVHSSVAAALLVIALASTGTVPLALGVSLVLGANVGSGLIAVGLMRHDKTPALRIAVGNLIFRLAMAGALLLALQFAWPRLEVSEPERVATLVALAHLGFNALLVAVGIWLVAPMDRLLRGLVPEKPSPHDPARSVLDRRTSLNRESLNNAEQALANALRETLHMAELVEMMLRPVMDLYETGEADRIRLAKQIESSVDAMNSEIKLYLAAMRIDPDDSDLQRRSRELSSFATNLEHVGDIVIRQLLRLAEVRRDKQLTFSSDGWEELVSLHDRVMASMQLSLNVLISGDRDSARQLIVEKDEMRIAERRSQERHLQRLNRGTSESIETSDIHLETVRALRTINSLFCAVAYPILADSGELLDSRLTVQADP